jgi:hypothetical protein
MTAEIKRSRSGQSFLNKPIGVVNVRTGSNKVHEQRARNFAAAGEFAFDLAKRMQVKEGEEFAQKARIRDENGNLDYAEIPVGLGRFGRDAAERILEDRYFTQLNEDTPIAAKQIADNPELKGKDGLINAALWEQNFEKWIDTTAKSIEASGNTAVLASFIDGAYNYKKEYANSIIIKNLETKNKQAKAVYKTSNRKAANELRTSYANGITEDAVAAYNVLIQKNNQSFVNGTINEDIRNVTEFEINNARLNGMVDFVTKDASPEAFKTLKAQLRSGSAEKTIQDAFNVFEPSKRTTFLNQLSEMATERQFLFDQNKKQLDIIRVASVGIAESKDMPDIISAATYKDSDGTVKPLGTGVEIFSSAEHAQAASNLYKKVGHLDPSLIKMGRSILSGRNYDLDVPELNANVLSVIFSSIESDQKIDGKPVFRPDMGFDKSDLMKLDYLRNAIADGPTALEKAQNILVTGEKRVDLINAKLPEELQGKSFIEIADNVAQKLDINPLIKEEMRNVIVDSLVLHGSFSEASDAVNAVIESVYTENSAYVEGPTAYAPEVRIPELAQTKDHRYNFFTYAIEAFKGNRNVAGQPFAEKGERNPLNEIINKKISLSTSPFMTRDDITLVPDQSRISDGENKRTVYFIKDKKTKLNLIDSRGTPLVVDTNEFKNLIKAEAIKDEKYENRYVGLTDEVELMASGLVGYLGLPVSLSQEFLKNTIGRLNARGLEFDKPAIGSQQQLREGIRKLFDNPDNPYFQ